MERNKRNFVLVGQLKSSKEIIEVWRIRFEQAFFLSPSSVRLIFAKNR